MNLFSNLIGASCKAEGNGYKEDSFNKAWMVDAFMDSSNSSLWK
jgi:hypothetical protein